LLLLVRDPEPLVAESAAFACGEIAWEGSRRASVVRALVAAARHDDALVRESAVAALGALGDPAGLPAILGACTDQPSVRRRAVLALAPFDGPEVETALTGALTDSDWQTRQAAEDLAGTDAVGG
jgi:HEAT repeat protein